MSDHDHYNSYSLRRSVPLALVMVLAAQPGLALAQDAQQATPEAPVAAESGEDIIVVGTAGAGTRRQDAAFAVTTIDDKAINQLAPASTAEVLRLVPGVSVESSGGQNGANIFVRGYPSGGDAEFVTIESQGVPIFPPPTLSFLENSQLIRIDETLKRIEAVRGGTGALFSSGQPGLTMNFVQLEGSQTLHGLIKGSVTTFGDLRADSYVSGPLGTDTTFMVGGFYATGRGRRDPQFTAEKGGQITANIRHDFDRGSLMVYGRYLNDHGQWLLTAPVIQDGNKISAYPGFDARTDTLAGNPTQFAVRNDGSRVDLADGRGAKIVNLGGNFDYELVDHLKIRERVSWLKGSADTVGLVPNGPPTSAAAFAAGLGSTIGSLTFVNSGIAVSPNQQVMTAGLWSVTKDIESFVNDVSLEFKTGRNTLTVGGYYAKYSSRDHWNLGNNLLLPATPNAEPLNLVLANGQIATRDGFTSGAFFNVNAHYDGRDVAFYGVDELQITDKLRIDGGVRYQHHKVTGSQENNGTTGPAGLDGDPNTLYDNNDAILDGTFSPIYYSHGAWSWTAGANYDVTSSIGLFARYSRGNSFPFFDNLRSGVDQAPRVDTWEGGLKVSTTLLNAYLTVFHNNFTGLASSVITSGAPIISVGGARATGVELEGALRPLHGLSINYSATWLDAKYHNFFTPGVDSNGNPISIPLDGNQVQRQPKWQWRIAPAYEMDFGGAKVTLYTAVDYIGNRFSDVQNEQLLPNYYKWDAGLTIDVNERVQFQASVDNITNTLGLTEGNPRLIGSQGSGVILGRSILGRSARFSIGYKF
jgi:iron complex outermembrane receptor protein